MTTASLRRAGAGLLLLYAVVAVATAQLSPGPFRPLFDGFAPPEPYRWVNPPPEVARDNRPPVAGSRDVPLGPEGSEVTNLTTGDAQALASLEVGSVPPNPPDTFVRLALTPLDAGTLGPLPPGLRPLSNAYHVTLAYQPSQVPVSGLARPGTVALTATTGADRLLYSPDGREWQEKPSRPYGAGHGRFGGFEATGFYVAAGAPPPPSTETDEPAGPNRLLLVLVGAAPIIGAILVLRPPPAPKGPPPRSKRRKPPTRRRRGGRRRS